MAALTVTDGVFGARSTECPATFFRMVDYNRTVDFAKREAADNANYALLPVPKGFMISHLAVEQLEYFADASKDWTFKLKSDSTQIGGTFTPVTTGAMVRVCDPALASAGYVASASAGSPTTAVSIPAAKFSSAADMLCVCIPDGLTGDKASKGKFTVHMIGYQVFGESLGDVPAETPAWTEGQTSAQAAANISGGDPMFDAP